MIYKEERTSNKLLSEEFSKEFAASFKAEKTFNLIRYTSIEKGINKKIEGLPTTLLTVAIARKAGEDKSTGQSYSATCNIEDYPVISECFQIPDQKQWKDQIKEVVEKICRKVVIQTDQAFVKALDDGLSKTTNRIIIPRDGRGITIEKLMKAKELIAKNKVICLGTRHVVMDFKTYDSFLNSPGVDSYFPNESKEGTLELIEKNQKFSFHPINNPSASQTQENLTSGNKDGMDAFLWHKDAVGSAFSDIVSCVFWQPQKQSYFANLRMRYGVTTCDGLGTIRIEV